MITDSGSRRRLHGVMPLRLRQGPIAWRFAGFFDLGVAPHEIPVDIDDRLDENAALIPRMILILRKLARIREAAGRSAPLSRRNKVGRNDPCPAAQARNTNAVAVAANRNPTDPWDQKAAYD